MASLVFFGYSSIGYESLRVLISLGVSIDVIYTHPNSDDENIWFKSVKQLGEQNNILVLTHTPTESELNKLNAKLVLCSYYRNLLPTRWLLSRELGSYNIHGSLLPKFRGAQPTNWAVINGATETGITLHKMSDKVDSGDIINQLKVEIKPSDDAIDVINNLTSLTEKLITDVYPKLISGGCAGQKQDDSKATVFPRRAPKDGKIDFRASATSIHNLIRGCSMPYPGAYFYFKSDKIFIWKSRVSKIDASCLVGRFVFDSLNPTIACIDGLGLEILKASDEDHKDCLAKLTADGDDIS